MERDYYDIGEEFPEEIRDMATFIACFHLSSIDFGAS